MLQRSLFVPNLPTPANSEFISGRSKVTVYGEKSIQLNQSPKMNPQQMFQAGKAAYSMLPEEGKQYARDKVASTFKRVADNPNQGGRSHSSGYALSRAPNPAGVQLDSGIEPDTYTTDKMDARENHCSPLHLTALRIVFPNTAGNKLLDYFNQVIGFDIQTKAQENVSFNLNVANDFSLTKILTAFNALVRALQVYFFYASLMGYHANVINKNEGMIALRTSLTPNIIESLTILERRLADTPVPPRLYELVRYLSSTFYSGDNQGAALIKFVPHALNGPSIIDAGEITACIAGLNTTDNNTVYSLMRRAVPKWSPKVLLDVPTIPIHDSNFTTIFANAPYINYGTAHYRFPAVAALDSVLSYNSFTNVLDGVAFALTGAYVNSSNDYQPGLVSPDFGFASIGQGNTRRSFYEVSGVKGFYVVQDYPFLVRARAETYYSSATTTTTNCHLPGTDKCLGVTPDSIRETTLAVLDYLFSADTIPESGKQSSFGKKEFSSKSRSKSRR